MTHIHFLFTSLIYQSFPDVYSSYILIYVYIYIFVCIVAGVVKASPISHGPYHLCTAASTNCANTQNFFF